MQRLCALSLLCVALAGCGSGAKTASDTGARQCVIGFGEALLRHDWTAAHDLLHPESKKRLALQSFTAAARAYLRDMGFTADTLGLRACEEREGEATGHVIFSGRAEGKSRRYRDALVMKKTDEGWGIVLPASWGM